MSWTDAAVETFKKLYDDENLSYGAMAAQMAALGFSRNALIGKSHRLGWAARKRSVAVQVRRRASRDTARTVLRASLPPEQKPRPVLSPVPIAGTPPTAPAVITMEYIVEFMKAGNHNCRYPLWGDDENRPLNEKWYCGAPANVLDGRPYCAGHHRIVRTPVRSHGPSPLPDLEGYRA